MSIFDYNLSMIDTVPYKTYSERMAEMYVMCRVQREVFKLYYTSLRKTKNPILGLLKGEHKESERDEEMCSLVLCFGLISTVLFSSEVRRYDGYCFLYGQRQEIFFFPPYPL